MSYSFDIVAPTKATAMVMIAKEFAQLCVSQPTHEKDREAAIATARALVKLLAEPFHGDEIHIHMNGSLSWTFDEDYVGANINVSVQLKSKLNAT